MTKVFKLLNGEEIIASAEPTDGGYMLKDPAAIVLQRTEKGMGVALAPYMPYAEEDIKLYASAIVSESTPNRDMANEYSRIFGSGIQVVSSIVS